MNLTAQALTHLLCRFNRLPGTAIHDAAALARAGLGYEQMSVEVEHALFAEMWHHLSYAIDMQVIEPEQAAEFHSLEMELAGHVLKRRHQLKWLVRAHGAPVVFSEFSELVWKSNEVKPG